MSKTDSECIDELTALCNQVKTLVSERNYTQCKKLIYKSMSNHPHAPHPHNLLGIVLEKETDHISAMKHFRAAWALDPAYLPAHHNLNLFGTFFQNGSCAFDESDCITDKKDDYQTERDGRGIGHIVKRK